MDAACSIIYVLRVENWKSGGLSTAVSIPATSVTFNETLAHIDSARRQQWQPRTNAAEYELEGQNKGSGKDSAVRYFRSLGSPNNADHESARKTPVYVKRALVHLLDLILSTLFNIVRYLYGIIAPVAGSLYIIATDVPEYWVKKFWRESQKISPEQQAREDLAKSTSYESWISQAANLDS